MVFAGMAFLCSTRSFRNCIQSKRNDQTHVRGRDLSRDDRDAQNCLRVESRIMRARQPTC